MSERITVVRTNLQEHIALLKGTLVLLLSGM